MDKKPPIRTCVACRTSRPKKELIRIVKTTEGVFLDSTGRKDGRGAYVCNAEECVKKLRKTKALSRAFKCEVTAEEYDRIESEFDANK